MGKDNSGVEFWGLLKVKEEQISLNSIWRVGYTGLYPSGFHVIFSFVHISFHFTLWVTCLPLESSYHIICIYSIFRLQIIY